MCIATLITATKTTDTSRKIIVVLETQKKKKINKIEPKSCSAGKGRKLLIKFPMKNIPAHHDQYYLMYHHLFSAYYWCKHLYYHSLRLPPPIITLHAINAIRSFV